MRQGSERTNQSAAKAYRKDSDTVGDSQSRINESDDEDEYRDVVVDIEHSRQLIRVADDFLEGRDDLPLLALPAPDDGLEQDDTQSLGGASL